MQNLTKDISRIRCMYFHVFKSSIVFENPRTYLSIGSNSKLLNEKTFFYWKSMRTQKIVKNEKSLVEDRFFRIHVRDSWNKGTRP